MKTTKEIAVILNPETVEIIGELKLRHGSPSWQHVLVSKVKNNEHAEEVSLMDCLESYDNREEREQASTSLARALNSYKISYVKEVLESKYYNTRDTVKTRRSPLKTRV